MASRWRKLDTTTWRRTLGPVVVEVWKWTAAPMFGWCMGTVDRRGVMHEMVRGGLGGSSGAGFTSADAAKVAAVDFAIGWANQIVNADKMEARRG